MKLTKELLESARSRKGSFSKQQLELLGLDFNDLWKGWQKYILEENFKPETIERFIALKDHHIKRKAPIIDTKEYQNIKFSKLTEIEWKVILDDFQRKLFNLPKETEIIVLK